MSEHNQHVLLIAKDFPPTPGGVETYSEELARAYAKAGCAVTVLTQHADDQDSEGGREAAPYVLHRVARSCQVVVALRMLVALIRLRSHESYDVVHSTTWRVGAMAQIVFPRAPRYLTVHGREIINFPFVVGPFLRWTVLRATRIVAVSHATAALLTDRFPRASDRVVVRWNGITYPDQARQLALHRLPSPPLRVMSLARLVPRKNIDKCLLAVAALVADGIEVRYTVAGKGPESVRLQRLADELGLGNSVVFAGYVPDDDLPGLYATHDIFLHPHSHAVGDNEFEGFGIVIADAMSFGCAVVTGRDGGPGDYIEHGVTGLLVDGDDSGELTAALRSLAADEGVRVQMAQQGRDYALNHFSWLGHVEPLLRS